MPRRFLIRENANPEVENALKDPYSNPALQADVPGTRKAVATHIPSSPFLFNSPISAHPRPMHGRHPHLSSSSPLSSSNRHTRLHKDSQSHPSTRMESKHACCPSLHLLAVRTTSARRLLASPAAITCTSHLDGCTFWLPPNRLHSSSLYLAAGGEGSL